MPSQMWQRVYIRHSGSTGWSASKVSTSWNCSVLCSKWVWRQIRDDQSPLNPLSSGHQISSDGHVLYQASLEEVSDMMEAAMWMLYGHISTKHISVIDLNHVWSKLCWLCWIKSHNFDSYPPCCCFCDRCCKFMCQVLQFIVILCNMCYCYYYQVKICTIATWNRLFVPLGATKHVWNEIDGARSLILMVMAAWISGSSGRHQSLNPMAAGLRKMNGELVNRVTS